MHRHAVACSTPTTEQTQAAPGFAHEQARGLDAGHRTFPPRRLALSLPLEARRPLVSSRGSSSADQAAGARLAACGIAEEEESGAPRRMIAP
jgi:hypothetical protein